MADFALARIGVTTVIDDNATLADAARAAGDYDNDTNKASFCDAFLTVQFDAGPPTAGDKVAELYLIYGDGAGTEVFPDGGDAAIGTDDTPQASALVGVFRSVNPSTTVDEVLQIKDIPLRVGGTNRFVLLNTSGQTMDTTWQMDIATYKWTSA